MARGFLRVALLALALCLAVDGGDASPVTKSEIGSSAGATRKAARRAPVPDAREGASVREQGRAVPQPLGGTSRIGHVREAGTDDRC